MTCIASSSKVAVGKKISSRGKLRGKGGNLPKPQGKMPIIGRKLARSTVRRTTSIRVFERELSTTGKKC